MSLLTEKQESTKVYDNKQTDGWKLVRRDQTYDKKLSTVAETLSRFGLMKNEIRVYLHLALVGEMKAGELAETISLHRTETYRILRDLEKKGIVFSIFEKPLKFTALPLDKAVDMLVDAQKMEIKLLEKEKTSLVELWRSIPKQEASEQKEIFQIIEGDEQVLMKANELLQKTENKFQVFASANYLSQLYYNDFSDNLKEQAKKINVTLLTDNSLKSTYFLGQLTWLSGKSRIVDDEKLPCFMISDNKEVLITFHEDLTDNDYLKKKNKVAGIWTNNSSLVKVMSLLFSKIQ